MRIVDLQVRTNNHKQHWCSTLQSFELLFYHGYTLVAAQGCSHSSHC